MDVHPYTCRAGAAVAAAALLACTSFPPAEAAVTARTASTSQAANSGTWGAAASLKAAPPYGTGSLTLTFTNSGPPGKPSFEPQYFTVGNTGTLHLTAADYTATTTAPASVHFVIDYCTGVWNAGTCAGGSSTTFLTTPGGSSTTNLAGARAPGSPTTNLQLRATAVATGQVRNSDPPQTLTIDVRVNRIHVRAATTAGS